MWLWCEGHLRFPTALPSLSTRKKTKNAQIPQDEGSIPSFHPLKKMKTEIDIDKKILRLLKILQEEPKKGIKEKDLLKKGFSKKDLENIEYTYITQWGRMEPLIKINKNGESIWKFRSEGTELINKLQNKEILESQRDISKKQIKISNRLLLVSFVSVLVAVALVWATISIGTNSSKISNQQTQILEQTSQTIKPNVKIVSSQGYQSYKLASLGNYEMVAIGVINLRKSKSPYVRIEFNCTEFFYGKKNETSLFFDIKDFESLDYQGSFFNFKINPPDANISTGKNNLTFLVNCPFCEEPLSYQNIEICIYNESPLKECGKEWGYF